MIAKDKNLKRGLAVMLLVVSSVLHGEIKIPRSVYTADKIAEAKSKAQEEGKSLAFVYTDPGST